MHVDEAVGADPPVDLRLLLGQEAGLAPVALPVLDVLRAVGDVEVTRQHGVPAVERPRPQAVPDRREEAHLLLLARGAGLAGVHVGRGDRDHGAVAAHRHRPAPRRPRPSAPTRRTPRRRRCAPARTGCRDSTATPERPGTTDGACATCHPSKTEPASAAASWSSSARTSCRVTTSGSAAASHVMPPRRAAARMPLTLAETRITGTSWQPTTTPERAGVGRGPRGGAGAAHGVARKAPPPAATRGAADPGRAAHVDERRATIAGVTTAR